MNNLSYSFESLVKRATSHLMQIGYSPRSLDRFRKEWFLLAEYMEKNRIAEYSPAIGSQYIMSLTGHIDYQHLNAAQKNQIYNINILSDFAANGFVPKRKLPREKLPLTGEIGNVIIEYIKCYRVRKNLSPKTIQDYYRMLSVFFNYLYTNNIYTLSQLNYNQVIEFSKTLQDYSPLSRNDILCRIKDFCKFLFQEGYLSEDLSNAIIKPKLIKRPKLPSVYSPSEVDLIVHAINRATPEGKRDYCIILLAARLGIRTSDIMNLKFSNIIWEKSIITFTQFKTGIQVELPLTAEIGNAIIDYLRFGRPDSTEREVFVRHTNPYVAMSSNQLYLICKKYMKKAGIVYDSRRHGLHSLRHSLATNLLNAEVNMTTIAQILGHKGSSSTKNYLRVDINLLRKCILEVPNTKKL